MGQISLTISLIMIGLFAIAIISFAMHFADDTGAAVSISDDPELMELYSDSDRDISDFSDKAEESYTSILETTIEPGSDSPPSSKPFEITTSSASGAAKNILKVGYTKIFGSEGGFNIFLTAFFSVLTLMGILYVIKTWRGNPD